MRTLIHNADLKRLFTGVSVAAAAGLLLGAAMYPDLNAGEIKGPQMLMAGGGPRADVVASDPGLNAYNGRIPEYVTGSDATQPARYALLAYDDRAEDVSADTGEADDVMAYEAPPEIRPARFQEPPREPAVYPSQQGNRVYDADLPAPPTPPTQDDEAPLDD